MSRQKQSRVQVLNLQAACSNEEKLENARTEVYRCLEEVLEGTNRNDVAWLSKHFPNAICIS